MTIVGLEVFFASVESEIKSPEDALVALIHWMMISNNYICVGVGETVSCFFFTLNLYSDIFGG